MLQTVSVSHLRSSLFRAENTTCWAINFSGCSNFPRFSFHRWESKGLSCQSQEWTWIPCRNQKDLQCDGKIFTKAPEQKNFMFSMVRSDFSVYISSHHSTQCPCFTTTGIKPSDPVYNKLANTPSNESETGFSQPLALKLYIIGFLYVKSWLSLTCKQVKLM